MDDAASRKELDQLLAGHSARTVRLAAQVSKAVAEAVARREDPFQAVASGMDKVGMAQAVRDTVATAVVQSVCVGYGIWPSVSAAPPEAMGGLRKTALSGVWDESGMKLSDRLHGTDTAMRAEIAQAIKGHVDAKASAWDAQRKIYDGYGMGGAIKQVKLSDLPKDLQNLADKARKVLTPEDFAQLQGDAKRLRAYADRLVTAPLKAAYGQMADRLEKGLTKGLDRLVQTATEEKARYHASRILRTEAARAWGQGFHAECLENQDVVGIKWNLSTSHKIFDICDFNHQADLYGMGPGVYPKAKWPRYPAHPHCHCPQSKVFVGMVPPERDNVEAGGKAALDGMTESQRKRLLTIKGAQGFKGGSSWKGDLRNHDGAVSSGMSPGARAVVMGVKQWQPDLQLVPGTAAAVAKPAVKVEGIPEALTERQRNAVIEYSKEGYKPLNNALWSGSPSRTIREQASVLASALDLLPQVEGTLYRGIQGGVSEVTKILAANTEGTDVAWLGFTSTSTDRDFADYHRDQGGIMVHILNGKGADISGISDKPNEKEVLLKNGTRFKVEKSLRLEDGTRMLIMRQL